MDKTEGRFINNKGSKMKKYDKEYSTQYVPEVEYLKQYGIRYTFVKKVNGVSTYKYDKTPKLFGVLFLFYLLGE